MRFQMRAQVRIIETHPDYPKIVFKGGCYGQKVRERAAVRLVLCRCHDRLAGIVDRAVRVIDNPAKFGRWFLFRIRSLSGKSPNPVWQNSKWTSWPCNKERSESLDIKVYDRIREQPN